MFIYSLRISPINIRYFDHPITNLMFCFVFFFFCFYNSPSPISGDHMHIGVATSTGTGQPTTDHTLEKWLSPSRHLLLYGFFSDILCFGRPSSFPLLPQGLHPAFCSLPSLAVSLPVSCHIHFISLSLPPYKFLPSWPFYLMTYTFTYANICIHVYNLELGSTYEREQVLSSWVWITSVNMLIS